MHKGKLDLTALREKIENKKIKTVLVAFTDHYGRLLGKELDAKYFFETVAQKGTHACNYLLTTDIEMEPVRGYDFANWELGYGDFHLIPDLDSLRKASWLKKTAIVLCDISDAKSHNPISIAPRNILKKQIDALVALGFSCKAASELEYYIFTDNYSTAHEKAYHKLNPESWYLEDYNLFQPLRTKKFNGQARKHLSKSGIQVENSKGEWGLGQHELNIKYTDILEMGDRHIIFKQCLKDIARKENLSVTFMAKYATDQAGSSCHIHLSLWKDGKNAFAGSESLGKIKCSKLFKYFLAGWIANISDVMPLYAPTVNSYKRFTDASWAPTRLAWSYDNRTAGFRVVGKGQSLRIECRIPGADCNAYLALAASLACGLDGMARKLSPPEIFEGDIYKAQELDRVPHSLKEANAVFRESAFAKRAFGEDVVKHYAHHFEMENSTFEKAVTDWERIRYFERI